MIKKTILATVFLLAFVFCLGSVLACGSDCDSNEDCPDSNTSICWNCTSTGLTTIEGKIYEGNLSNGVAWANVTVICHHNGQNYTKPTISWHDGKYIAYFDENKCDYGDNFTVNAVKNDLSGTNSGSVNSTCSGCFDFNVGIVNVPLVPEFGLVIGTLTAVSAISIFFFVRKR